VFAPEGALPVPLEWWFPEGSLVLVFEKPGYQKATQTLNTSGCPLKNLEAQLDPVPSDGALKVSGMLPEDKLLLDGGLLEHPEKEIRLLPGKFGLEVRRADGTIWKTDVVVKAGETAAVDVPAPAVVAPVTDHDEHAAWWPYAAAGGGGVCLVAGVVTFLTAADRLDDIDAKYSVSVATPAEKDEMLRKHAAEVDDRVTPLETTSYVLWGVGLVSAGVGIWQLATNSGGGGSLGDGGTARWFVAPGPSHAATFGFVF